MHVCAHFFRAASAAHCGEPATAGRKDIEIIRAERKACRTPALLFERDAVLLPGCPASKPGKWCAAGQGQRHHHRGSDTHETILRPLAVKLRLDTLVGAILDALIARSEVPLMASFAQNGGFA